MRKLISFINMTLDGFCDHTAMIADDDLHRYVNGLFIGADAVLFGRVTYQLMESSWPPIVLHPTGNKAMDEFAVLIDNISKIVFSRTLKKVIWKNSILAGGDIKAEVLKLKGQPGKNLLAGSPGIIMELMRLGLIDEYQFCVHPVVLGRGLPLFRNITDRIDLKLTKTRTFGSGAVTLVYEPVESE